MGRRSSVVTVSEFGVLLQNGFCDGLMYAFRSLNNFGHLGRRESLNFDGAIAVGSKSRFCNPPPPLTPPTSYNSNMFIFCDFLSSIFAVNSVSLTLVGVLEVQAW